MDGTRTSVCCWCPVWGKLTFVLISPGKSQGTTWKVCFVQVPTANIASFAAPGSLLHSLSYANTGSKQPETKSAGRKRPCRKIISQHTPSTLQWKSTLIQMFSPFKAMKIIPRPWNRFGPWVTDTNFWLKNLRISPVMDVSIYFHWFLLLDMNVKCPPWAGILGA